MKVWTIPHTQFAAMHLVSQIQKLGHECSLVSEIIHDDDDIYIIYGALNCPVLPKNYVVYQTEIAGTHFFNAKYKLIIQRAIAVWDYSQRNVCEYKHLNRNRSVVTPGINIQQVKRKDIPVLFYGWIESSERRKRLLNEIQKFIEIKVVTNLLGDEMSEILNRSQVVLNLHFYDFSPLEVFRINEALSHGCMIVSEPPVDRYYNHVYFAENVPEIITQLRKCKIRMPFAYGEAHHDLSNFDNLMEVKSAIAVIRRIKPETFIV